jgi:hypothetical protein
MPGGDQLRDVAQAIQAAGSAIYPAAGTIVHHEASLVEAQIRALDGQPTSVVVQYGTTTASLTGVGTGGIANANSPLEAMDQLDTGSMADSMESQLLAAGVALITGGRA